MSVWSGDKLLACPKGPTCLGMTLTTTVYEKTIWTREGGSKRGMEKIV